METIELKDFKGFREPVKFDLERKNMLVCGENGSGKTSLFKALVWLFYHDKMIQSETLPSVVNPIEIEAIARTVRNRYNNKRNNREFELKVDGDDYISYPTINYKAFFIDSSKITSCTHIHIQELIDITCWPITDFDSFMRDNRELIEVSVNDDLKKKYLESISIKISMDSPYIVTIEDNVRGLSAQDRLNLYFNEAKLHIISLSILIAMVELLSNDSNNVVVIDDVISSMDGANRVIFAKTILEDFKPNKYQTILLTHNVAFRNLFRHIVNTVNLGHKSEHWKYYTLYEINGIPRNYSLSEVKRISDLRQLFTNSPSNGLTPEILGNTYRKHLEVLIHRIAELLMIGAKDDTKNLISVLSTTDYFYFNEQGKNVYSLIKDIESIVEYAKFTCIKPKIRKKIEQYKTRNIIMKSVINDSQLYQKLLLHPLSHISGQMVTYTSKELLMCLDLMENLEAAISKLEEPTDVTTL